MPCSRQMSCTLVPASACFRMATIWVSVNRLLHGFPPIRVYDGRNLLFVPVSAWGKLTESLDLCRVAGGGYALAKRAYRLGHFEK